MIGIGKENGQVKLITLVKIKPGKTSEGLQRLREIPSLVLPDGCSSNLSWITYGSYDMVWAWEAPDMGTANTVLNMIKNDNLIETETMAAQDATEIY